MKIDYILTPLKRYATTPPQVAARPIQVRQLGIQKVVIVKTKSNGGMV